MLGALDIVFLLFSFVCCLLVRFFFLSFDLLLFRRTLCCFHTDRLRRRIHFRIAFCLCDSNSVRTGTVINRFCSMCITTTCANSFSVRYDNDFNYLVCRIYQCIKIIVKGRFWVIKKIKLGWMHCVCIYGMHYYWRLLSFWAKQNTHDEH